MPFINGGGGGGGGLTPPVTITGTTDTVPLTVRDAAAQTADSFTVKDSTNNPLLQVGPTGTLTATMTDATLGDLFSVIASGGNKAIRVQGNGSGGVGLVTLSSSASAGIALFANEVDVGNGGAGTYCYVGSANVLFTGTSAAPADGDLSAGQFALWFDATNGAASLNIKAKQANGTVKTATIPVIT